ncbi:MAG TPA: type IV toxin-antitoxin system AbiEi family antitoxin, partial [Planctomycetota bacterium]
MQIDAKIVTNTLKLLAEAMQLDLLEQHYLKALRRLGVEKVRPLGVGVQGLARWELVGPWGAHEFAILERTGLAAAAAAAVAAAFPAQAERRLLVIDRVGPVLAKELRRLDICFVDAGGNAWLAAPGLWIQVEGRPVKTPRHRPARLYGKAGMRLLYLLLHDPNIVALPQRELATRAGIGLGNLPRLLGDLREGGFVEQTGAKQFALTDGSALRQRWEEMFLLVHRPKLEIAGYRLAHGEAMEDWGAKLVVQHLEFVGECGIGGELGAALLTKTLRPATATIYRDKAFTAKELAHLHLVPTDELPQVQLLTPIANQRERAVIAPKNVPVADPLLLRVELLYTRDPR